MPEISSRAPVVGLFDAGGYPYPRLFGIKPPFAGKHAQPYSGEI